MIVLKIIGAILLGLLALGLLLCLFVLTARVRVDFRGENGAAELRFGLGPLRLKIWPLPPALKNRSHKPAHAKEKPSAQKMFSTENLDWAEGLDLLLDLLGGMREKLVIDTLWIELIIGTGDAARTGLLLGYSAAATGMLLPILEQNFNVKTKYISVDGDFDASATRWKVKFIFAVRPGSLLAVMLHNRKRLYALYRQIAKKEEAEAHE